MGLATILLIGGIVFLNTPNVIKEENPTVRVSRLPIEESRLGEMLKDKSKEEPVTGDSLEEPAPASSLDELERAINNAAKLLEDIKSSLDPEKAPEPEKKKLSQSEIYTITIERLVNLLCNAPKNEVIIVSGFLISEQGHILTNAHASDPLEEKKCQVRKGSPARAFAQAEEIFKPNAYISTDDIETKARSDFAIWKITGSSGTKPLPEKFSYFKIDEKQKTSIGEILVALSYPSELLGYQTLLRNLTILFTETTVVNKDNDLILSGETLSSQSGSSGGVLLSQFSAQPVGIIFAVEKKEQINERILYSLSTAAIENIIKKETGQSLEVFLAAN